MTGVVILSDGVRAVGESIVGVRFKTDPDALAARLPDPLTIIRPGEAFLYHGEAVIRDSQVIDAHGHLPPRLSTLYESGVVIPCELNGQKGCFFTGHHADRDWSVKKFREMGYSSEFADIRMTRYPAELRDVVSPGTGQALRAKTVVNGTTNMECRVTLDAPADHPWQPFAFTMFGRRHIEDATLGSGSKLLADDVTAEKHGHAEMERVWKGSANITLHPTLFDDLNPVTVIDGYFFEFSLVFEGMNVLWAESPQ